MEPMATTAMVNITDAQILEIDEHVRQKWSELRWKLVEEDATDDEYDPVVDPVGVFVTSNKVFGHYRTQPFELGLGATCVPPGPMDMSAFVAHFDACLRKLAERIADKLARLGAKRSQLRLTSQDFEEPRDAWLPFETIAWARDYIRVGDVLRDE